MPRVTYTGRSGPGGSFDQMKTRQEIKQLGSRLKTNMSGVTPKTVMNAVGGYFKSKQNEKRVANALSKKAST